VSRSLLPLAALVGPQTIRCELCGDEALGVRFMVGINGHQHRALELCGACVRAAAAEIPAPSNPEKETA
jgi:ribosome-binding protein aMBF1 (putative translation factor)